MLSDPYCLLTRGGDVIPYLLQGLDHNSFPGYHAEYSGRNSHFHELGYDQLSGASFSHNPKSSLFRVPYGAYLRAGNNP